MTVIDKILKAGAKNSEAVAPLGRSGCHVPTFVIRNFSASASVSALTEAGCSHQR